MVTLRKYLLLSLLIISCSAPIFANRTEQHLKQALWGAAANGLLVGAVSAYSENGQMNPGIIVAATLLSSFAVTGIVRNFSQEQKIANKQISFTESFACNLGGSVVGGPILAGWLARKYAANPVSILGGSRW